MLDGLKGVYLDSRCMMIIIFAKIDTQNKKIKIIGGN